MMATYVVLPGNVPKGDWVDILVEDKCQRNCEIEDVESLCTKRIGKDLDSICHNKGSKSETINCD